MLKFYEIYSKYLLYKVERVTFGYPNKRKILVKLFSKQIPKLSKKLSFLKNTMNQKKINTPA